MMRFFRYFKNENENPFEGKDQDKAMLWFYERCYASMCDDKDQIEEYRGYVKDFREDDGVPEGFKALLFNRFMKTAYSVVDEIPAFKSFYEKYYRWINYMLKKLCKKSFLSFL